MPKVIRAWAGLDLLVTAVLALPPTALWFIDMLYQVNGLLGATASPPTFAAVHLLFVCLMGGLGVVWAMARLTRPSAFLGRLDGWARLWVAGLILYFILTAHAPLALYLFVASELLGGLHQLWVLRGVADQ
ncbi:MAG: hypothetical protein ACPHER_03690 [Nevskiales bacterium]